MKAMTSKTIVFATASLLVVLLVFSLIFLKQIEQDVRESQGEALTTVLETTHQAILSWMDEHRKDAKVWAGMPELVEYTQTLLRLPRTPETLIHSEVQREVRQWFHHVLVGMGYRGFFIIAPDNISLASTRDGNTGITNLLVHLPGFLDRIWQGKTGMGLPQRSDVPLRDSAGVLVEHLPTMFVAAPIRDASGTVIAVLTFRINPEEDFSSILQQGRIGATGETYAFDRTGLLISESRFPEDLRRSGLIKPEEHSILNVEIRDPGGNLIKGERPMTPRHQQPLTRMAASAVAGGRGVDVEGYRDYRGVPVLGAWLWDDSLGMGLATEVDVAEVVKTQKTAQAGFVFFALFSAATLIVLAVVAEQGRRRALEQEKRFRATFEQAAVGIAQVALDGKWMRVNQKLCDIVGYDHETMLTLTFQDITHPRDLDRDLEHVDRLLRGEAETYSMEKRYIRKDRSFVWINLTVSLVRDAEGAPRYFISVIENIDDRKKAEAALARQELEARLLYQATRIAAEATSFEDALKKNLGLICQSTGWSLGHVYLLADDGSGELVPSGIWCGDETSHAEFRDLTAKTRFRKGLGLPGRVLETGEPIWVADVQKDTNFPRAEAGVPIGLHGAFALPVMLGGTCVAVLEFFSETVVNHDRGFIELMTVVSAQIGRVLERSLAEKEILDLSARNEMILNSAGEGIYGIDLEGRTTFINPAAARMVGWDPDDLIGKQQHDIIHHTRPDGSHYPKKDCRIYATLTDGKVHHVEDEVFWRKDGTSFPVEYLAAPLHDEDGTVNGAVVVYRDISERLEAQAHLIQVSKLASLGEMATGAAHEINQPLNIIRLSADSLTLMLDEGKTLSPDVVKDSLEKISSQTLRAANIIDRMRVFGRKPGEEAKEISPTEAVAGAASFLSEQLRLHGIDLVLDLPEACRPVLGDLIQLEQVILNLLTNARDAIEDKETTGEGGDRIAVTVTDDAATPSVTLAIEDTGGGIPQDILPMIFDPFFTTKDVGKGTGVGLSISFGIVTEMGGTITAKNTESGAMFIVTLPAAEPDQA